MARLLSVAEWLSAPISPPPTVIVTAIPVSISVNPASPSILDNSAVGTQVAAITVTMSDGSTFAGSLGMPNTEGGNFALSGANVVTNATPLTVGTHGVIVSASQGGTTIQQSLSIAVTLHSTIVLTNFILSSPTTDAAKPMPPVGVAFKKGQTQGPLVTSLSNTQVTIMRRWNDNSVKHAIVSGIIGLNANVSQNVNILEGTPAGTNLTSADILAANPDAIVNLGPNGSISLRTLLSAPIRTFISGPMMVECHYKTKLSGILVQFYVRLWQGGRVWVRTSVENGYVDVATSDLSYTATVSVGGATVFGPTALTHYSKTRWIAEGWIGGDPQITPKHNITDLVATKLVPNYFMDTPPATSLNGLYQSYVPYDASRLPSLSGDIAAAMGGTGDNPQIGILPQQDALFITSLADSRAYNAVLADAKAINNFPIVWRGSADSDLPTRPSIYPTWTVLGAGGGGGGIQFPSAGPLIWDNAHHPSSGFTAYLLTGDYLYLEDMQLTCSLLYLMVSSGQGSGVNRKIINTSDAVRMPAWMQRSLGQLAAISPSPLDSVTTDHQQLLANNFVKEIAVTTTTGINHLGVIDEFDMFFPAASTVLSPTFMHHFWVQTFGYLSDIEPVSGVDVTNLTTVRDWLYKIPVGMFGDGAGTTWCFSYVGNQFRINNAAPSPASDLTQLYDNWNLVWNATYPATVCVNTLQGPIDNTTGQWATPLPGLAYAVDHGAIGAQAAWNRLTGSTNWTSFRFKTGADTYAVSPRFGIGPRDALTTFLAGMPTGSWKAVPSSNMSAVTYGNNSGDDAALATAIKSNTGPAAIYSAWGGATLDTAHIRLIICSGGHADYHGNEVYAFNLPTLSWSNISKPSDPSTVNTSTWLLGDGTPAVPHTYDGVTWDATQGKVFFLGAGQWDPFSGDTQIAWYMNPATMIRGTTAGTSGTNSWAKIANWPSGNTNAQSAYDSTSGHVWAWQWQSFGLFEYIPGTNSWTTHGSSAPGSTITAGNQTSAAQPGVRLVSSGGGWTYWWDFTGVLHIQTTTGTKTAESAAGPGFVWHAPSGKFVAWASGGTDNRTVYILDPSTWTWTAHTAAGDIPTAQQPNGTFGRFQYDVTHNCFVLVNDITQNVFIYKPDF